MSYDRLNASWWFSNIWVNGKKRRKKSLCWSIYIHFYWRIAVRRMSTYTCNFGSEQCMTGVNFRKYNILPVNCCIYFYLCFPSDFFSVLRRCRMLCMLENHWYMLHLCFRSFFKIFFNRNLTFCELARFNA